jgi:hypothetical protein
MKVKLLLASLFACIFGGASLAQTDFNIGQITVINLFKINEK